eukprot:2509022-Prymnesium_polylepis.1
MEPSPRYVFPNIWSHAVYKGFLASTMACRPTTAVLAKTIDLQVFASTAVKCWRETRGAFATRSFAPD